MIWQDSSSESWQNNDIGIDPYLDWHIARSGLEGESDAQRIHALLELAEGVSVESLLTGPKLPSVTKAQWQHNLGLQDRYRTIETDLGIDGFCTGGFVTLRCTPRFLGWLRGHARELSSLIRGITLSRDPDKTGNEPVSSLLAESEASAAPTLQLTRGSVVLGVIDDFLPLAHPRFHLKNQRTRWCGAWLQGSQSQSPGHYGTEHSAPALAHFAKAAKGNEIAHARLLGQLDPARPDGLTPLFRASHGSHITDLLAGYDPASEAAKAKLRPLIGVQLPSAVAQDSSGLSLAAFIIDGLAYILAQASLLFRTNQGDVTACPIVINISYGILNGPHDGTGALERAMALLVERYNAANPEAPVMLVTPAGNSLQGQGHIRLPRGDHEGHVMASREVVWRILPDDATSSFVEIWLPDNVSEVSLTPPGTTSTGTVSKNRRMMRLLDENKKPLAQMLYVPPAPDRGQPRAMVVIAMAPTRPDAKAGMAPHGRWTLAVSAGEKGTKGDVHGWILRDDTPFGQVRGGRQTWFEDDDYKRRDALGRIAVTDEPRSAIQRGGAFNGLFTRPVAASSNLVVAGACVQATDEPTFYSGAGYPLSNASTSSIRGPDVMAPADQTSTLQGVLASGMHGGSVLALNGTSTSSPQLARSLADHLSAMLTSGLPLTGTTAAKIATSLARKRNARAVNGTPDPRKGFGAITANPGKSLEALWLIRMGTRQ